MNEKSSRLTSMVSLAPPMDRKQSNATGILGLTSLKSTVSLLSVHNNLVNTAVSVKSVISEKLEAKSSHISEDKKSD